MQSKFMAVLYFDSVSDLRPTPELLLRCYDGYFELKANFTRVNGKKRFMQGFF